MFSGAQHFPVAKRCTCMAKLPLAGEGTSTDAQFVRRPPPCFYSARKCGHSFKYWGPNLVLSKTP